MMTSQVIFAVESIGLLITRMAMKASRMPMNTM